MNILISGSVVFDRIMDFQGKFADHILPDKIDILNVCFMINELKEHFGGTAGNIAYALSLLNEKPYILATAGRDFGPYSEWLDKNSIPVDYIKIIREELTASAYITTDNTDNQITIFNPGAMKHRADFNFDSIPPKESIAIVSPGNIEDMFVFSGIYKQKEIDYLFDPGQSLPVWGGEELKEMIEGSFVFISNEYELQLTQDKTSLSVDDIVKMTKYIITTGGEGGSVIRFEENSKIKTIKIPSVPAARVSDPTGAGDAFRGGLLKGLSLPGKDIIKAAQIGSTLATYSVEVYGTQSFSFTMDDFNKRYKGVFGEDALK